MGKQGKFSYSTYSHGPFASTPWGHFKTSICITENAGIAKWTAVPGDQFRMLCLNTLWPKQHGFGCVTKA